MNNSKGNILLFLDDDVELDNFFLEKHVKNFKHKEIDGVAGRIIDRRIKETRTLKVGKFSVLGRVISNWNNSLITETEWMPGGNFSIRKNLFFLVNGFDDKYQGNFLFEDTDFSYRLHKKLNRKFLFDPEAYITHLASDSGGCNTRIDDILKEYWFNRNKLYFMKKNGDPIQIISTYILLFIKSIFYSSIKFL